MKPRIAGIAVLFLTIVFIFLGWRMALDHPMATRCADRRCL